MEQGGFSAGRYRELAGTIVRFDWPEETFICCAVIRGGVSITPVPRYADPAGSAKRYARLPSSANMAPCGSSACAIQAPPGTSMGPLVIAPPPDFTRSIAASMLPTLK